MEKTYPVLGHSMRFLLEPGDAARVRGCAPGELRAGDVALLVKWRNGLPGGYVVHRVLLNASFLGRRFFLCKGDANLLPDWPPSAFQPAGLVTAFDRAGTRRRLPRGGPRGLFLAVYSAAAAKLLYLSVAAASSAFRLLWLLLPGRAGQLLDPLWLAWEGSVYPALSALAAIPARLPASGPAPAGPLKSGRISSDETWSGRVTVADYLAIERGVTVTVLPGAEVSFERREPWFFPVLRASAGGGTLSLESGGAKLLVYGSLKAAGKPGAGVSFSGPAFAGLHALGDGSLELSNCALRAVSGCALSARDRGRVDARSCAVGSAERGAEFYGRSSASLEACSFSAGRGPALLVSGEAVVLFRGGSVSGSSGPAAELWGDASAGLLGVSVSGCAAGIMAAGSSLLRAGKCEFSGLRGPALYAEGAASASLDGCSVRNCGAGLYAAGGAGLRAERSDLSGNSGPSAELAGRASLLLSSCRSSGEPPALALSGSSSAAVTGLSAESSGGPVVAAGGRSSLRAASSVLRSSGGLPALALSGSSSAALDGLKVEGVAGPAVSADGGAALRALSSRFCSASDALRAAAGASVYLAGCSLAAGAGAGLKLSARRVRLLSVRASGKGGLSSSSPARIDAEDLTLRGEEYGAELRGSRLRARGLKVLGGSRGGVRISGGSAFLRGCVLSGSPYPGLAAGDGARLRCSGVSFEGLPWEAPRRRPSRSALRSALFRFAAATSGLPVFKGLYRAIYLAAAGAAGLLLRPGPDGSVYLYRGMVSGGWVPGLSDMDLALLFPAGPPEADWELFVSLRRKLRFFRALFPFTGEALQSPAPEFFSFMRCWGLKGAEFGRASRLLGGARLVAPPPARSARADLTEAFYAYTLLLGHFLSPGLPPAFRRRNCAKSMIDVRRCTDLGSPARESRSAYAASLGLGAGPASYPEPSASAFAAFAALHAACPPFSGGSPAPPPASGFFNTHAFEAARAELAAGAGGRVGVVLDPLYRVCVVLPDWAAADRDSFLRAAEAFLKARGSFPYFSAAPLLLTRSSFAALCGLPYLNNPSLTLDLRCAGCGARPEDGGIYSSGVDIPPALPAEELKSGAALAARHFSASWRSLWGTMPPHYFFTRAAGLRLLLETGEAVPFSRPAELAERFRGVFGAASPRWDAFLKGGYSRENYLFTAVQAAAAAGRLDDAGR